MNQKYSRRRFLERSSFLTAIPSALISMQSSEPLFIPKAKVDIGDQRQLFVDDYILGSLDSGVRLQLHHPEPQERIVLFNKPWEGNACDFVCVFQDEKVYRMYYGALQYTVKGSQIKDDSHPYFLCYIESEDGINWHRPALGIVEFKGSKANNIILDDSNVGAASPFPVSGAMFRDDNPDVPKDARYKSMIRNYSPKRSVPNGLLPMKSADGIHWKLMSETPVITAGEFDSQNLAFWDPFRQEYRAYWRYKINYIREIRTAISKDFIHWTGNADLHYVDSPMEELYTNVIKPYYRAPQIFLGLPVRYNDRGLSEDIWELPNRDNRRARLAVETRLATAVTESLLMTSRDGVLFQRWNEAFLRPGIERPGTWNYGQQFIAWSMVETASALTGAPNELSFYAMEGTWGTIPGHPDANGLRRYTLRLDGFASVHAGMEGGEVITRPFTFKGSSLSLNFSTSAAGSIYVEILDENRKPVPGFTADDCEAVFGDTIDRKVFWKGSNDVSLLAGKTVHLRFAMKDSDLYSFKFG